MQVSGLPSVVKIVEVGPRDGLQNEKVCSGPITDDRAYVYIKNFTHTHRHSLLGGDCNFLPFHASAEKPFGLFFFLRRSCQQRSRSS